MLMFELIAEQRIAEAIERGELADLPGAGRPLDLGDDPLVPEDLRLAYRILKNAGFVPPELEAQREILGVESCPGGFFKVSLELDHHHHHLGYSSAQRLTPRGKPLSCAAFWRSWFVSSGASSTCTLSAA